MSPRQLYELEIEEIDAETSEEAMLETWAEILARLRNVEPERFGDLFGKALALALETLERYPELQAEVEDRLDEISLEMWGLRA